MNLHIDRLRIVNSHLVNKSFRKTLSDYENDPKSQTLPLSKSLQYIRVFLFRASQRWQAVLLLFRHTLYACIRGRQLLYNSASSIRRNSFRHHIWGCPSICSKNFAKSSIIRKYMIIAAYGFVLFYIAGSAMAALAAYLLTVLFLSLLQGYLVI